jgi:hypothetical protein
MGEHGEWTIDDNEDETALVLSFTHMGEEGVETFDTAMPYGAAKVFAESILEWVENKV